MKMCEPVYVLNDKHETNTVTGKHFNSTFFVCINQLLRSSSWNYFVFFFRFIFYCSSQGVIKVNIV